MHISEMQYWRWLSGAVVRLVNPQKEKLTSSLGYWFPLPVFPLHTWFLLATSLLPFPTTYRHYGELKFFPDPHNIISTSTEDIGTTEANLHRGTWYSNVNTSAQNSWHLFLKKGNWCQQSLNDFPKATQQQPQSESTAVPCLKASAKLDWDHLSWFAPFI